MRVGRLVGETTRFLCCDLQVCAPCYHPVWSDGENETGRERECAVSRVVGWLCDGDCMCQVQIWFANFGTGVNSGVICFADSIPIGRS